MTVKFSNINNITIIFDYLALKRCYNSGVLPTNSFIISNNSHRIATITAVLIAANVLAAGVAGYLGYQEIKMESPSMSQADDFYTQSTSSPASATTSASSSIPNSWKTYKNDEYGFSFEYPSTHTAFSEVDQQDRELIPAPADADQVSISEPESHVFCCEPMSLSFSIENTLGISDVSKIEEVTIAGEPAFIIRGKGNLGEAYKKIFFQFSESEWLVITQGAKNEMLDKALSTLTISRSVQNPEVPLTLDRIKTQYTEELLSDPAFVQQYYTGKLYTNHVSRREPAAFVYWDHDNDGEDSLVVFNKLYVESDLYRNYEVILFDIKNETELFNPRYVYGGPGGYRYDDDLSLRVVGTGSDSVLETAVDWRFGNSSSGTESNRVLYRNGKFVNTSE